MSSGAQAQATQGYRPQAPFLDELFEPDGAPRPTAEPLVAELRRLGPEGLVEAGRRRDAIFMQQGITFETSGSETLARTPLPAGPRAARAQRRGMARDQARPGPAHPRAEQLRRRCLPRPRDRARGARALAPGRVLPALRARCPRHPTARRRLHARRGLRPRAPQRRHVEGDRGQRAHPLRHLLRAREPRRDGPPGAGAVRLLPRAPRGSLPAAAAASASLGGTVGRERGDRGGVDSGASQPRLLRARVPGAADGGRAGRGLGSGRPRRRPLHAHDPGPGARPRCLPPARRRLRGPAGVPRRLPAGRARPRAGLSRRKRRDRERVRHRASPTTRRSTASFRR